VRERERQAWAQVQQQQVRVLAQLHGLKQATTLFGQLLRVRHGSLSTLV